MHKAIVLLVIIFVSPLIGGVCGILLDQITYSISEEYYTKFKFFQFDIPEYFRDRFGVSIVGFLATWWVGLPIGIVIGSVGLIQEDHKSMIRATVNAFIVTIIIAILTPLTAATIWFINLWYQQVPFEGYAFSVDELALSKKTINNPSSFFVVAMIHNFNYLGGFLGLIGGVVTQITINNMHKKQNEQ